MSVEGAWVAGGEGGEGYMVKRRGVDEMVGRGQRRRLAGALDITRGVHEVTYYGPDAP